MSKNNMNWEIYNPDETTKGFECRWCIQDKVLYIEAHGTDSIKDWVDNFMGALSTKEYVDATTNTLYIFHRKWYYMAFRFFRFIRQKEFNVVRMRGHSMGAAVLRIVRFLFVHKGTDKTFYPLSYGSPRPCKNSVLFEDDICFVNRGDYVSGLPFWFKSNKPLLINRKWQFIWKAHQDYDWRF